MMFEWSLWSLLSLFALLLLMGVIEEIIRNRTRRYPSYFMIVVMSFLFVDMLYFLIKYMP
jgi:hypothetical protein